MDGSFVDGSVFWSSPRTYPGRLRRVQTNSSMTGVRTPPQPAPCASVSGEPRTMWQQEALRRYIKDHRDTPAFADSTVFLSDPPRERELDERLLHSLWPSVRDAVEPGPWTLLVAAEAGTSARDGLTTPRHADISRALTFLIEDPDRPRMPGAAPPWFCRGTLSCASDRFFVAFDFTPQPADRLPVSRRSYGSSRSRAWPVARPSSGSIPACRTLAPPPSCSASRGDAAPAVGRPRGFRGGAGRHGEERARDRRRSLPRTRFHGRGRVRPGLRAPDGRL